MLKGKDFIIGGGIFLPVGLFFLVVGVYQLSFPIFPGDPSWTRPVTPSDLEGFLIFGSLTAIGAGSIWYGISHRG